MHSQKAEDFIKLMKEIQKDGSKLETVLCDLYTANDSKKLKDYFKENNIAYIYTTADAAQSNGLVERVNQTLINKLRCNYQFQNEQKKKA
jgi:hypothetical protein